MNERVRALRREHGWTQLQLADMVGCRQSTIGSIEAGTRTASLKLLPKIARALNTTIDYLVTGEESRK
jgi:transcriptional regulator with XRE-family HTH domain